jgi:predicted 3-demethylubiquinone-9 3-methyltransferase (glyoxalase superfamily)
MAVTQKIKPYLWYDTNAEEAVNFYVSIFKDSRVVSVARQGEGGPAPKGSVITIEFELEGQRFVARNGGPHCRFNEAMSLAIECESQQEIDELWAKLTAGGGEERPCGWLKDKFGLSWQVYLAVLPKMLQDEDDRKSTRVLRTVLQQMKELEVAALERAHAGR